jgi:hypothetical protein
MIHDEALKSALTGHLMSAELAQHLKDCPECRAELASLKALESELSRAWNPERDAAWEGRLLHALPEGAGRQRAGFSASRAWARVAASTLLAAAFLAAWMTWGPPSGVAVIPIAQGSPAAGSPASPESGWALYAGDEDTTAVLLQTCESYGKTVPQSPSPDIEHYLLPNETGGWDG